MVLIIKYFWPVRQCYGLMAWHWTFPRAFCTGWMPTTTVLRWFTSTPLNERSVMIMDINSCVNVYLEVSDNEHRWNTKWVYQSKLVNSGSLSWFNRWCMRVRSLTTPLAYAITKNFSFGMSTVVVESTNYTRPLERSPYSAARGHQSLKSGCTMRISSKVCLSCTHSCALHDLLIDKMWGYQSDCLLVFSCRHQCLSSYQWWL